MNRQKVAPTIYFSARHLITLLIASILLTACGGGGGGGSSDSTPATEPTPTDPGNEPIALRILDAVPGDTVTNTNPDHGNLVVSHLGHSDLDITYTSDCQGLTAAPIRRQLFDLSTTEFDQILDHRISCDLTENTAYALTVDGVRTNDAAFTLDYGFSTGVEVASTLTITDQTAFTRDQVDDLFTGYVEGALVEELDLPSFIEALIIGSIIELSEANWSNLVDPDALYSVVSQRVTYPSRNPQGEPVELSALIAFPAIDLSPQFVPRDKLLVLTHATGSTPGDLDPADAWFILANLFASRGYMVVAPDNFGRGGTDDAVETYLMANRTALNALDLIVQILAEPRYDEIYAGSDVSIVGYSQGGHSAVGLWQLLSTNATPENQEINVKEVYAGGAPHNLYQTVRGVLQHLDGDCNDNAYCRFVDSDVTVPFATNRILPAFLTHTQTGITLDDAVDGETLHESFVTGFLAADSAYDDLKAILQLNSFTNIESVDPSFSDSSTILHLYHSDFDRLVPVENTQELATLLSPSVTVDFHENRCNADGYEAIFNLTDIVGVLHTLCGLAVLDDAMADLK